MGALRASSAGEPFRSAARERPDRLVGRDEEFDLLLRRWSKAKSGEGQVLLLSGEAGIGKSRLTAALLECIATEPHTKLRYFCSPQHTDSALYPVIGQMERAAGLGRTDEPRSRLDKLDAVLAQTSTSVEDAAFFAQMLSLPNDGRYPALDLTPQQRRQRTLEALVSQAGGARAPEIRPDGLRGRPLEHPTSLELLGRVVHQIASLHVLLIVNLPAGIRAALARTAARGCARHQIVWRGAKSTR